jgi:hypothetical protein
MLDKGLTWKKQLYKVINKTYKAFWTSRVKFWENLVTEIKGDTVYWIYTVVVRPIVTYAATVWWPTFKLKTSQAELSKLQRLACLGITGAMKTTLTAAVEVLL